MNTFLKEGNPLIKHNWEKLLLVISYLICFFLDVIKDYVVELLNIVNGLAFKIVVITLIFAIIYFSAKWYLKKKRRQSWIEYIEHTEYKGLIAAVSSTQNAITPAESAIQQHLSELTYCWLLYTQQSEENYKLIRDKYKTKPIIGERYKDDDGHEIIIEGKYVENIDDIKEAFNLVKIAYQEAELRGLKEQDIILDFTGGTANISAAMTLVSALYEKRRLEYLKPNERNEHGQPVFAKGFTPLIIDLVVPGE